MTTTVAVAATWPLALRLPSRIPLGTEHVSTVPHASAWALAWVADRLTQGGSGIWDAPIFHPTPGAFALSEPLLLQGVLVAPALWLGASSSLAHNLALLLSLMATGLVAYGFAGHLGARVEERLAAAAIVVLTPYAIDQIGVLTLLALAGPAATLWMLVAVADRPVGRRAVGLGVAFAATYLSCAQYGLFTALALVPALAWLLWRTRRAALRVLRALTLAGVCAAVLVAPVALAQLEARDALDLERPPSLVADHAAELEDFALSTSALRHPWLDVARGSQHPLYPGGVAMLLAGLAVGMAVGGRRRPRRDLAVGVLVLFGVSAQLVAMSPHLPGGDVLRVIPGVAQVRSIWRAAGLWQLSVMLLAGVGLLELRRLRLGRMSWAPPVAAATLAVVELWPRPARLAPTPRAGQYAELGAFLHAHTDPDEPVGFLPPPATGHVADYVGWAWWMAAQPQLGRPMTGGYSSYFPQRPYRRLLADLRRIGESSGAETSPWWASHHEVGVRYWVTGRPWWEAHVDDPSFEIVWRSADDTLVVVARRAR